MAIPAPGFVAVDQWICAVSGISRTTAYNMHSCFLWDMTAVDQSRRPSHNVSDGWPDSFAVGSRQPARRGAALADNNPGLLLLTDAGDTNAHEGTIPLHRRN